MREKKMMTKKETRQMRLDRATQTLADAWKNLRDAQNLYAECKDANEPMEHILAALENVIRCQHNILYILQGK